MMDDIIRLNELYVKAIRTLPLDFLLVEFNLDVKMIQAIREIPEGDLSKLTETNQLLISVNEEKLCRLLKQLPQL